MATLVAIGYPDQDTAEQARTTVAQLEAEFVIQADQVAVISRDPEGRYHVHTPATAASRPPAGRCGAGSGACCSGCCS
jgi:uncharacterized membrane protein